MAVAFNFHPEALSEYADAANYYRGAAGDCVAGLFIAAIEGAITTLTAEPARCRVVDESAIRRCVVRYFPYVVYYRLEQNSGIVIYAVMHCSREPNYWRRRVV